LDTGAQDSIKALYIDVPPCITGLSSREPTIKTNVKIIAVPFLVFLGVGICCVLVEQWLLEHA
jgi:hypothetical protein